jgi:hypothetical protein
MTNRTVALGATIVALAVATALAAPQQMGGAPQPQTTQMVLKGKAPVSTDLLKVKLPTPQEADLSNGLHLIVLEDHRVPLVTFQIIIPGAGGYFDPTDKIGLASYTASLMREGTKTRTSPQISEALETMAAPAERRKRPVEHQRVDFRKRTHRGLRQVDGPGVGRAPQPDVRS